MIKYILILSILSFNAFAEFYADIGIGIHDPENTSWVERYTYYENDVLFYKDTEIYGALGKVEIGYTWRTVSIEWLHISSLHQDDGGFTGVFINKRLKW